MSLRLDAPRTLPAGLAHLSYSSISTYLGCPERFRRRYIDLEYEPTTSKMLVGKIVGRAVAAGMVGKIETGEINAELLTDSFSTEWDESTSSDDIDWEGEQPGEVKDSAAQSLVAYAGSLMPTVDPVTVEEGFSIQLPGTEFDTIGYLDFLDSASIYDLKVSMKAKSQSDLDTDLQGSLYVAAKRIQTGELMSFKWHAVTRPSPAGRRAAFATELTTSRTNVQVNSTLETIALVARELDWRASSGDWSGAAPGYWKCSERMCGYWDTCRFGGLK